MLKQNEVEPAWLHFWPALLVWCHTTHWGQKIWDQRTHRWGPCVRTVASNNLWNYHFFTSAGCFRPNRTCWCDRRPAWCHQPEINICEDLCSMTSTGAPGRWGWCSRQHWSQPTCSPQPSSSLGPAVGGGLVEVLVDKSLNQGETYWHRHFPERMAFVGMKPSLFQGISNVA